MAEAPINRIKTIFAEASEIALGQRAAFLDQECGNDAALRAEVEALLSAAEKAGEFLSSPTRTSSPAIGGTPGQEGPGAKIGPYKLLQLIGEGGFGSVFMAEQEFPVRRRVALKIIKLGMDIKQVIARFEAERQALALMDHPNIAKVFDAGATGSGRPYFVMELVKGEPITDYADHNQLTITERLELFSQVCYAVQHAHQKGIIHRDIKPRNVLVSIQDGGSLAKVIDFGIAKAISTQLTDKTLFTEIEQLIGTPQYMSPEQAAGSLDIDTRTDIYSLGVLLYELLTGTTPFSAEELRSAAYDEMRRIIREDEPPKPSTRLSQSTASLASVAALRRSEPKKLDSLVRGDLDWIVMKTLEKNRGRRYGTPGEISADLRRYLGDEVVLARPPSAAYQLTKFYRRHKAAMITGSVIAATILAALVVSSIMYRQERIAHQQSEVAAQQAELARLNERDQRRRTEAALLESERQEAEGLVAQGNSLRLLGRVSDGRQRIDEAYDKLLAAKLSPRVAELELCDFDLHSPPALMTYENGRLIWDVAISPDGGTALAALADGTIKQWDLATGRLLKVLTGHHGDVRCVVFRPDGLTAVSGGDDKTLKLWDLATGHLIRSMSRHSDVCRVAISPNGQTALSCSNDGTMTQWDLATGKVLRTFVDTPSDLSPVWGVAFSPQGDTALSGGEVRNITLWNLTDGRPIRRYSPPYGLAITYLEFTGDGKNFVSATGDGTLVLWDVATGRQIRTFYEGDHDVVVEAAFSPDGHLLAGCGENRAVKIWDVASGNLLLVLGGDSDLTSAVKFSPDGRTLLSGSLDGTMRRWDVATGREAISFAADISSDAVLSPDGRMALSGGSQIKLWDLATGHEIGTFLVPPTNLLSFSPDGRTFLSGGPDQVLHLLDIASGRELRTFHGHAAQLWSAAFSPDGRTAFSGSEDGVLKLWDVSSGSELRTMLGHSDLVRCVTFTPDGHSALSASYDHTVKLWDVATGRLRRTFSGHVDRVSHIVASPDGKTALSAASDRKLRLWDLATGSSIAIFTGSEGAVNSAIFSPDGRTAYSIADDGCMSAWDVASGREIYTFSDLGSDARSVNITPDGRFILYGGTNTNNGNGEELELLDLGRASAYREFQPKLQAAQKALQADPNDASALGVLGEWWAFRGIDDWAVDCLENARAGGVAEPPLLVGRCYWNLNRLADAKREFTNALAISRDPQEQFYLKLCIKSMSSASTRPATTQPIGPAPVPSSSHG